MKIVLFGHFGTLNSGNESTLIAILSRLRIALPDCDFCCVCTNPQVVVARDEIEAVPISTRDVRIWDRNMRLPKRLVSATIGFTEELKQYLRAFRTLEGTEALIVPGTGLLTDAYGLSGWGPYSLFKWALVAKLRRCKVMFVSVGAGPIDTLLGRVLIRLVLSFADYRSFRDDSSVGHVRRIGFKRSDDRVYPDLVFSLPDSLVPSSPNRRNQRRVVGLGLMSYAGKYSVANPIPETYAAYLESFAVFVEWLLERGYDVRLLLGDGDDAFVIEELKSLLQTRLGAYEEERVLDAPMTSISEVLSQLVSTDVVVVTRFHSLLLSLLLSKPVISISFHHKCTSLMQKMGLSEYTQEIHGLTAERLIARFQNLEQHSEQVEAAIRHGVRDLRIALDEQYELLLSDL